MTGIGVLALWTTLLGPQVALAGEAILPAGWLQGFHVSFEGRRIGSGKIRLETLARTEMTLRFRVSSRGSIQHPRESRTYEFQIDMQFELKGRRIRILSTHNTFNKDSETHAPTIERLAPFLYIVPLVIEVKTGDPERLSYLSGNGYYVLRILPGQNQIEGLLHCDDEPIGRFFFRAESERPGSWRMERIQVTAAGPYAVFFELGPRKALGGGRRDALKTW